MNAPGTLPPGLAQIELRMDAPIGHKDTWVANQNLEAVCRHARQLGCFVSTDLDRQTMEYVILITGPAKAVDGLSLDRGTPALPSRADRLLPG